MTTLLALLLAIAGASALALSQERHHREVFNRSTRRPGRWRGFGSLAWAGSLGLCTASDGWATGAVHWAGLLTLASLATALTLSFASRAAPSPRRPG
jgi:hypothetical protein